MEILWSMDCPRLISLISTFTVEADLQQMQQTIYSLGPGIELGYCGRKALGLDALGFRRSCQAATLP